MERTCDNCGDRYCSTRGKICSRWKRQTPHRLWVQIDDMFRDDARHGCNELPRYRYEGGSYGSSGAFDTFYLHTDDKDLVPDAFILVSHHGEDWRRLEINLVANDPRVKPLVQPIIDQYIEDLYQYHIESATDEKWAKDFLDKQSES